MAKTGLVIEGGGMKCAYSAGILDRFLDEGITFDYVIGVSAGSANAASYLAGQRDRNRRFYTEYVRSPEYFGVRPFKENGNIFNLDFIYGDLSNSDGRDPLDYNAMLSNPAQFVVVATDAKTGKPHYFTKEDMKPDDYRVIRASCSLPVICKPQEVNGRYYFDGGVSDSVPVRKAMSDGCEKLVVILSKPRDFVKDPEKFRLIYSVVCRKYPRIVRDLNNRHLMFNRCMRQAKALEKKGKAFLFSPSDPPEMGTYTMDPEVEQQLYDLGVRDFDDNMDTLLKFIG